MKKDKNNVIPMPSKRPKVVKIKEPFSKRLEDLKAAKKEFEDILNKKE